MLSFTLFSTTAITSASPSEVSSFAQIVKEISLDKPVPTVNYLQAAPPWNKGELHFEGTYGDWIVTVIADELSGNVKGFQIRKPGPDILEELLPPLVEKYGQAKYRESLPGEIKSRSYGWYTGNMRNTTVWYQFDKVFFTDSYI